MRELARDTILNAQRPTLNAQHPTLNSELPSWTLDVERWALDVFVLPVRPLRAMLTL